MIPVDQTRVHADDHPNCVAACLASIFEVPLDRVDSIELAGAAQWQHLTRLCNEFGYQPFTYTPSTGFPAIAPRGYHLACSDSHACVALDGVIVHDPHPRRAGLELVTEWIMLVPIAKPCAPVVGRCSRIWTTDSDASLLSPLDGERAVRLLIGPVENSTVDEPCAITWEFRAHEWNRMGYPHAAARCRANAAMIRALAAALPSLLAASADRKLIEDMRVAMRSIGSTYYLVEAAAERARKSGHASRADELDHVYGRLFWMDHALGTLQERVAADEAKRRAARSGAPQEEPR